VKPYLPANLESIYKYMRWSQTIFNIWIVSIGSYLSDMDLNLFADINIIYLQKSSFLYIYDDLSHISKQILSTLQKN